MRVVYFLFIIGSLLQSLRLASQELKPAWQDSLKLSIGTVGTAAAKDFQPFWLVANQFGTITDQQWDFSTNVRLANEHVLNYGKWRAGAQRYPFKLSYTFDIYNNNHFKDVNIIEGNLKLNWRGWQFRAGRYREVIGEVDSALSTGSLGISGNAMPIPKISIAVPEYKPFPWTNGWLQFKGLFSHGWMGNDRYFYSYLHEKAFYLRAGRGKLKLFGGIAHFAEWGGKRADYQLDRGLKAFWNVISLREANDGSVPEESGKRPNRAGDHRGMMELGFDLEANKGYWHFYHQTPFESGTGIDIRNVDRLAGISFRWKESSSLFKKLVFEFIYTKQMEGFATEQQSYYNNGAYKTGWEYNGAIVGTPLFINRKRGRYFFPLQPFDWGLDAEADPPGNSNIIGNRIIGVNLAGEWTVHNNLLLTTILTFNSHSLDRSILRNDISSVQNQFYSVQKLSFRLKDKLTLLSAIAIDVGDLYNNFGGMLGLKYDIK
ncbi:capsule assembly Wzi family protein [Olivibacter sp. XZL3]|uniref:capsule assembly Wzi family protein n=1 Tax=Olivibacter sp. XZL3 TaxID=1735116 RepID=UPI0010668AE3|nr:capsule assembly Wzi family protein [Olivibacter sp. XZL3]